MTLLELCMNGAIMANPFTVKTLDFVIPFPNSTVFVFADWMRRGYIEDITVASINCKVEKSDLNSWTLVGNTSQGVITTWEEAGEKKEIDNLRLVMDVSRDYYVEKLMRLREEIEAPDVFAEWMQLVNERPQINAVERMKKRNGGLREVGSISLLDSDNKVVDVLVIDGFKNAATAISGSFLEIILEDFLSLTDDVDIGAYLQDVKENWNPRFTRFSDISIISREGFVSDISAEMFSIR